MAPLCHPSLARAQTVTGLPTVTSTLLSPQQGCRSLKAEAQFHRATSPRQAHYLALEQSSVIGSEGAVSVKGNNGESL